MFVDMEVIRIGVEALIPLSIAGVGWIVSYRFKELDKKQWGAQKLTEKRISIFDEISPKLNKILCYSILVGQWKSLDPPTVITLKREVDARIHGHKFLLGSDVYDHYRSFIKMVFDTDDADSGPTRLKIVVQDSREISREGSEERSKNHEYFSKETVEKQGIKDAYDDLGRTFIDSFNITSGRLAYNQRSSKKDTITSGLKRGSRSTV